MNKTLKFKNGKFTIMTLGDIHEHMITEKELEVMNDETKLKLRKRADMHRLVAKGISTFNPDLIVLLGDTLCEKDESEGFKVFREQLTDVLKPILDSGIPFCYVLGNHEHDNLQEEQIVEAYKQYETMIGVNDETAPRGNFNCNILVKNSEGTEDILNLWFIDSNNLCDDRELSMYDWVHQDQIEWYEKKSKKIADEHKRVIPAILFQHIPVYEENYVMREAKFYERPFAALGHHKFSDKYYMKKPGVKGYLGEGPCSPMYNAGQFESWKKMGDVKAAFFGHDHLNDFTGIVRNIILGQNKTSGFCCYTDGCRSLVRIITVNEENPWKIETSVHHFREFGLKPTCLGPIAGRITDRQSMACHAIGKFALIACGILGIAGIISLLF
ncbi:MAG: metallophosphoesterase [Clostridia bacterium]|nr:metallophosphoesterase [Clostridia bacterium]